MSNYAPEMVISRGGCRIEIWTEDGKVYPHTTGKVPRKVEDVCSGLRGHRKSISEITTLISKELVNNIEI